MARSFTNVKVLSALLLDGFSSPLARRGYAATAQSGGSRGGAASMSGKMAPRSVEDKVAAAEKVSSWVPDPVTGYYKPENMKDIVDVAELRATLLTRKFNH